MLYILLSPRQPYLDNHLCYRMWLYITLAAREKVHHCRISIALTKYFYDAPIDLVFIVASFRFLLHSITNLSFTYIDGYGYSDCVSLVTENVFMTMVFFHFLLIQYYMYYHSHLYNNYSLWNCLSFLSKETSSISTTNKYEIIGNYVDSVHHWNLFSSGLPFTTQQSSEQISEEETSRTEHYPWQRYLRESLPPARRQSQFHFSPIHTVPIRINLHQSSSNPVSPSLHSMSPPSYAELFLTPRTLANRSETSVAHSTLN